jgi:TonB family protein
MGASKYPIVRIFAMLCSLAWLGVTVPAAAAKPSGHELDAFMVRQRISRHLPKINRCYESALRNEPALAGKIAVHFAVAKKGDVREVKVVENTTGSELVGRCLIRIVENLSFQQRKKGKTLVHFTFPFVFSPQR